LDLPAGWPRFFALPTSGILALRLPFHAHQRRRRRDCLGELVQIDGSEHAWFEDRGAPCTLLGFVDDATSRLMQLRFVNSESAFDYFRTTRAYLEEHGKPVAFYSDKHGIFRVNSKEAAGGEGVTQFHNSESYLSPARRNRSWMRSHSSTSRCASRIARRRVPSISA
jgi:hypothetical protein